MKAAVDPLTSPRWKQLDLGIITSVELCAKQTHHRREVLSALRTEPRKAGYSKILPNRRHSGVDEAQVRIGRGPLATGRGSDSHARRFASRGLSFLVISPSAHSQT